MNSCKIREENRSQRLNPKSGLYCFLEGPLITKFLIAHPFTLQSKFFRMSKAEGKLVRKDLKISVLND